jgi:hypothetical protein
MTRNELQQIYFRYYNKHADGQHRSRFVQRIPEVKRNKKGRPLKEENGNFIKTGTFKKIKHY